MTSSGCQNVPSDGHPIEEDCRTRLKSRKLTELFGIVMDRMDNSDVPAAQSTQGSAKQPAVQPVVAIVACAGLGLLLMVLATPRTIAAWSAFAAGPALDTIFNGRTPSDDELNAAVLGLERAVSWSSSGGRLTNLALLRAVQAERLPFDSPHRQELLMQAEDLLTRGLSDNPADGYAWLRLAVVRSVRGAESRRVVDALMQSVDTAPNARHLWLSRIEMMLRYWPDFSVDELLMMRSQIRTIWSVPYYRLPLIRAADAKGQALMVRWSLSGDPSVEAEYQRLESDIDSR